VRIGLSLLNLRPGLVGGVETYVRALLREQPAPDFDLPLRSTP